MVVEEAAQACCAVELALCKGIKKADKQFLHSVLLPLTTRQSPFDSLQKKCSNFFASVVGAVVFCVVPAREKWTLCWRIWLVCALLSNYLRTALVPTVSLMLALRSCASPPREPMRWRCRSLRCCADWTETDRTLQGVQNDSWYDRKGCPYWWMSVCLGL